MLVVALNYGIVLVSSLVFNTHIVISFLFGSFATLYDISFILFGPLTLLPTFEEFLEKKKGRKRDAYFKGDLRERARS